MRIFPLYYGVFALLLLLTPLLHFHWSRWWLVWPAYLGNIVRFVHPYRQDSAFLHAANGVLLYGSRGKVLYLGHFWSLSLEEQFYLAWPCVVFWVRERRRLVWLCTVVVLLWPLLRVVVMQRLPMRYTQLELTYSFTPLRIDALLIGGLLALLLRGQHRQRLLQVCRWICAVAVPLSLLYLGYALRQGERYLYPASRLTWGQSVVDVFYAALVAVTLVPGNVVYRICHTPWLRHIGQISYGAYVFHDIPHKLYAGFVNRAGAHLPVVSEHFRPFLLLTAGLGTWALAELSFRFVESPILSLKERWAPSR